MVFYFTVSLLVSTVFCYLLFALKVYLQHKEISRLDQAIGTVGTDYQKEQEKTVLNYQKKINDYAILIANHKFSSNIFSFFEKDTLPNIWFSKFSTSTKQGQIDVSGQAESMDALSRQTAVFEQNEFVKKVSLLGSSIGDMGKINFNLSLVLDPKIYNYVSPPPPENPPEEIIEAPEGEQANFEKLITSFAFPLQSGEVTGVIDQENFTINLNLPEGTDLTALAPRITLSPGATVSPEPELAQDFTYSVVYTVTAEDGSSQDYTAIARFLQPEAAEAKKSKSGAVIAVILVLMAAGGAGAFFFWKKKQKKPSIDMSKIT